MGRIVVEKCDGIVTRQIGAVRARQLILLGEPIDAATALAFGLIFRVVPRASLAQESTDFAQRLAGQHLRLRAPRRRSSRYSGLMPIEGMTLVQ